MRIEMTLLLRCDFILFFIFAVCKTYLRPTAPESKDIKSPGRIFIGQLYDSTSSFNAHLRATKNRGKNEPRCGVVLYKTDANFGNYKPAKFDELCIELQQKISICI